MASAMQCSLCVPRKIRQLIADQRRAGFVKVPDGKGSNQKWRHEHSGIQVHLSGADGDDAKLYQEAQVREAISKAQEWMRP